MLLITFVCVLSATSTQGTGTPEVQNYSANVVSDDVHVCSSVEAQTQFLQQQKNNLASVLESLNLEHDESVTPAASATTNSTSQNESSQPCENPMRRDNNDNE